ncbi:glyoxylase-like metal-dependent hydrolase (beta-lactamase superfamily II) [Halospina denitrificans]|uniref:Glyoxylase-like metal-dependent hydrolase (Beta-lactamase superfamily II) n=1 Tax=Halospina denitrificans TaxID=332522 RepID=A0A4R7K1L2_9GAMM|nr:MBL fold metallo-hydrolase [Halospina denitrificans]TDT44244.1 glyoxylase-like metal-dependent hydrolase (beta-lactamase superfamily II) [Halospina denitrificans]
MTDIRPASTLVLVRDGSEGIEVLLLQRTRNAVFLPGFHVFPGGALSGEDGDTPFTMAALRECFEEAGILLVRNSGEEADVHLQPETTHRSRIDAGTLSLSDYCTERGLEPATDSLIYLGRWITPPGPPRRFDTHFFLARVPAGQEAFPDGAETVDHVWITPEQALDEHLSGKRLFVPPTLSTLRRLCSYRQSDELLNAIAGEMPEEVPSEPWPAVRQGEAVQVLPGESGYDEVRFLDPQRKGASSVSIQVAEAVPLTDRVTRITAPNAGIMTGPGTNTYLVRDARGFMVVDPGPSDEGHLEQVLSATAGQVHHILLTHTHPDHSPGAALLRERTGATVVGLPAPELPEHHPEPAPDLVPEDGACLGDGPGRLRVLHTPGHASNHLAFLMESEGLLFAGDLLMQDSTVVISPPDGDMADYMASLTRLLAEPVSWLLPGHGQLMDDPNAVFDYLITHRHVRERKLIGALRALAPADEQTLLGRVYSDVDSRIHPVAARSLKAHLLKLEREGRVCRSGDGWILAD